MTDYPTRFTNRADEATLPYTLPRLLTIRGEVEALLRQITAPADKPKWKSLLFGEVHYNATVFPPSHKYGAHDEFERNHPFLENERIPAVDYYRWALTYIDERIQQEVLR